MAARRARAAGRRVRRVRHRHAARARDGARGGAQPPARAQRGHDVERHGLHGAPPLRVLAGGAAPRLARSCRAPARARRRRARAGAGGRLGRIDPAALGSHARRAAGRRLPGGRRPQRRRVRRLRRLHRRRARPRRVGARRRRVRPVGGRQPAAAAPDGRRRAGRLVGDRCPQVAERAVRLRDRRHGARRRATAPRWRFAPAT